MENMRKVRKTMMKVLGYLIIFLFMMMTAVGSYQIITRYFFNRPSTVSEELLEGICEIGGKGILSAALPASGISIPQNLLRNQGEGTENLPVGLK